MPGQRPLFSSWWYFGTTKLTGCSQNKKFLVSHTILCLTGFKVPSVSVSNCPAREYPFEVRPRATPFSKIEPWREKGGAAHEKFTQHLLRDLCAGTHVQLASLRWAAFPAASSGPWGEGRKPNLHSPASDASKSQTLGLETGGKEQTSASMLEFIGI